MNIEIKSVTKKYGEKTVLDNFSAVIPAGRTTCIMGASGCGKTTLLRLLMGLEKFSGTISGVPERKAAVFQEDRLCESFTALSNVMLCADGGFTRADGIAQLTRVGLGDCVNQPVRDLSGGMRRRVAIVRAVMAKSDILFLDEAFKGLDDELKYAVIGYVAESAAGKTVIAVTHSREEAGLLAADKPLILGRADAST